MEENFKIGTEGSYTIKPVQPKVKFLQEMRIGRTVVPVTIELDLSEVDPKEHGDVISLGYSLYGKDTEVR